MRHFNLTGLPSSTSVTFKDCVNSGAFPFGFFAFLPEIERELR